jgi:hypothetical protein
MAERQQLGNQIGGVQRASASGRTTAVASKTEFVQSEDYTGKLLDGLSRAAGAAANYSLSELKKKQEADVVLQRNRAALGQRPTDAATQAGYVAHSVVGVQNKSLNLTRRLEQESKTFEGDDAAWSAYTASQFKQLQDETLSEYPAIKGQESETDYLGAITDIFSEQIPHLANVRISDSIEQEQVKRVGAFQENLLIKMGNLDSEQLSQALPAMLVENKAALQLTQLEVDKVLMDAAVVAANSGDERLIDFTKSYNGAGKVPLFQRFGELQSASKKAKQVIAAQNQGAQAVAQQQLIDDFNSGKLTFNQLASKVDAGAKVTGVPLLTDTQIRSLKEDRQRSISKKTDYNSLIEVNNSGEPLGLIYGDKTDRTGLVNALANKYNLAAEAAINASPDKSPAFIQQVKNRTDNEFAKRLSAEELVNDDWVNKFNSLSTLNISSTDLESGQLKSSVSQVIDLWYNLDEGARYAHAKGETAALMSNFELFQAQGLNPAQAIQFAQQSVRERKPLDNKVKEKAFSKAEDVADNLTQSSWYDVFSGREDATDSYRDRIRQVVSDATIANIQAGYLDPEAAAAAAGKAFDSNYTKLKNGQILFGQRKSLSAAMGLDEQGNDIELTLDTYLKRNQTALEDEGMGVGIDEMYFDRPAGRDTVYIRSSVNGMPISGPIPLNQLKAGRDAYLSSLEKEEAVKVEEKSISAEEKFLSNALDMRTNEQKAAMANYKPTRADNYREKKAEAETKAKLSLNPSKVG